MKYQFKKFAVPLFVLAVSAAVLCCYETEAFVQIVSIRPDNTAAVTHLGTNVSYKDDNGNLVSAQALMEQARKDCEKLKRDPGENTKFVDCAFGKLPELFGPAVARPAAPSANDGYFTVLKTDADKYFSELAEIRNAKPVRKKFVLTPTSVDLELLMPPGPIFDAKKSCVFMIQTPWPIKQTNADIVFTAYNLAVWNCGAKETHPSILITLSSGKE